MITKNINNIAQALEGLVTGALEGVVPPEILQKGRRGLNFALDLLQPHVLAMGLRVAKLSRAHVEVVVPDKERNLDSRGLIQDGVVMTSAIEACRFLWDQNRPEGPFTMELEHFQMDLLKPFRGELRIRIELPELVREASYTELETSQKSQHELQAQVFDQSEILLAQIRVGVRLSLVPAIAWS